jgi:hypothetical protein
MAEAGTKLEDRNYSFMSGRSESFAAATLAALPDYKEAGPAAPKGGEEHNNAVAFDQGGWRWPCHASLACPSPAAEARLRSGPYPLPANRGAWIAEDVGGFRDGATSGMIPRYVAYASSGTPGSLSRR